MSPYSGKVSYMYLPDGGAIMHTFAFLSITFIPQVQLHTYIWVFQIYNFVIGTTHVLHLDLLPFCFICKTVYFLFFLYFSLVLSLSFLLVLFALKLVYNFSITYYKQNRNQKNPVKLHIWTEFLGSYFYHCETW